MEEKNMKFCGKCGAQLEDNATVCPNCNEPVGGNDAPKQEPKKNASTTGSVNNTVNTSNVTSGKSLNKTALIAIIAGCAVAVIILIAIIVNALTGYKKPIKKYFKTQLAAYKSTSSYTIPWEYKKGKYSYKLEFGDKEKLDKGELKDLEEAFDDAYDPDKKVKFSKGYVVEVNVEKEYKEGDDKDAHYFFIVVKTSGKWCIYDASYVDKKADIDDFMDNLFD